MLLDSPYETKFNKIKQKTSHKIEGSFVYKQIWTFYAKNVKHIIEAYEYPYNIYLVSFYSSQSTIKNRYNELTKDNVPRKKINTCLKVCLDLYKINNNVSFCFIGAPTFKEIENRTSEIIPNTKRFKFYSKLIAYYFYNDKNWYHEVDYSKSFYAMISTKNDINHIKRQISNYSTSFYSL